MGTCWVLGGPDIWQRVLAARSNSIARKALSINALLLVTLGLCLAYLCSKTAVLFPEVPADQSFFHMLSSRPRGLRAAVTIGLVAAFLSTSDTELHAIATFVNKELSRDSKTAPSTALTRKLLIVVGVLGAALAILLENYLLDVYYVLLNTFMIMGATVLPILLRCERSTNLTSGAVLAGTALTILVFFNLHLTGAYCLLVTLPPLVLGFIPMQKILSAENVYIPSKMG